MSVKIGSVRVPAAVTPETVAPSTKRKANEPIALPLELEEIAQKTDAAYQANLQKHGVGSPLRNPNGSACQGSYKKACKTSERDKVALMSSPHKSKDPALYARVAEQETMMLVELQDGPHIPQLYDQFEATGQRYTTIQENVGPSLYSTYIDRTNPSRKPLPLDKLQRICKQLLESTKYLHQKGIIHGDIKTENCSENGHLFDFGLSQKIGTKLTPYLKYSRYYRPPETVLKVGTALSGDVWALGCTFFELFLKKFMVPVRESDDASGVIQADANMLHAYQDLLNIKFNLDAVHLVRPDLIEVDLSGKKSLIARTIPPSKPFDEEILSYAKGNEYDQFVDLLKRMLVMDPGSRITAEEALEHPYFTSPNQRYDCSFKLAVTGNLQMSMRILNHQKEILETIDLSKWRPSSCYHIYSSPYPYQLEFFYPEQPDAVIHTCPMTLTKDKETVAIDTTTFSPRPKPEPAASSAASAAPSLPTTVVSLTKT